MRYCLRVLPVLVFLGLVTSTVTAAESKAIQTMAGILVKLNHFPSDAEKQTLKQIADAKETTAHERVIAQALVNLQHKVSADDKPKLDALLKDTAAPESVKTLASIIVSLNHMPTDADKEKLKKLATP
jgi:hypothetical protein